MGRVRNIAAITLIVLCTCGSLRASDYAVGADLSFLMQAESKGMVFKDNGQAKPALEIFKDHGYNWIRLRLFHTPTELPNNLEYTISLAKAARQLGFHFLLDYHYSDTWADPGKQYKPAAWRNESFSQLKQSVYLYTKDVLQQLKSQGTLPDMVQVGNEINHGMIWPEGSINNTDSLAQLVYAGIAGVKAVDPHGVIMLHIALGGQNNESVFFINNPFFQSYLTSSVCAKK